MLEGCIEKYVPCISNAESVIDPLSKLYAGKVTNYLETMISPGEYDFYVCGQRNMIADVTALIDDMFDGSKLFIENFY